SSAGLGKGSEFVVELPAASCAPLEASARSSSLSAKGATRPSSKRILVVDDNEDAVLTLKDALEALGYVVEVAYDGPSALRVAEAFNPSIALLDLGLPVMDGYELAQRLCERRRRPEDLRLVAVTGYGQEDDCRRSIAAGFEHHLVKPIDLDELERVVHD